MHRFSPYSTDTLQNKPNEKDCQSFSLGSDLLLVSWAHTACYHHGHLVAKNRRDSMSKLDKVLSRICHAESTTPEQVVEKLDEIVKA
jgi:hypothetical protein